MANGQVDGAELTSDAGRVSDLDKRIIKLADRKLGGSLKTTFFYAYACKRDWEEITELFNEQFAKDIDLDTVKRYGDRVVQAIVSGVKNAEEFK